MSLSSLITPQFIKDTYVLGVDLTLDDGSPYPDILFSQAIESAISTLELELGIQFDPFKVKNERHDARISNKSAFYPFTLDHRPFKSAERLTISLGNYPLIDLPVSWITSTSAQHGQIHLIPTGDTIGSFLFRGGIPLLFGDIFSPYQYVPGYFSIDYISGFTYEEGVVVIPQGATEVEITLSEPLRETKPTVALEVLDAQGGGALRIKSVSMDGATVVTSTAPTTGDMQIAYKIHNYDPALIKAISLLAAISPLDIAGDLIAGAGIANFSVGVDGLSQSIGTTSSATNAGYGARIISYQKQLKELMRILKAKYRSVNIFSV